MAFKRPYPKSNDPSSPGFESLAPNKRSQHTPKSSQAKSLSRRPPARSRVHSQASQPPISPSLSNPQPRPQPRPQPISSEQDLPDFEDDLSSETILALDKRAQDTVGAAYYAAREQKLYLLSDVKFGGVSVLEQLKAYVQPTFVLVPSRIDEKTDAVLDPARERRPSEAEGEDSWADPYVLEVRPSNEFSAEGGKAKLAELRLVRGLGDGDDGPEFVVPGDEVYEGSGGLEVGVTRRQGKMLRLAGCVDLESEVSLGCASAVLAYLKRKRAVVLSDGERLGAAWRVTEVEMFGLEDTMLVNSDTFASLNIFQSESHPHSHNQGPSNTSGSKEDLSVYGLFYHLAKTPQGKYLLRQYFLRPSLNIEVIQERHQTLGIFLRSDNEVQLHAMVKSLKSIKNMRTVMIHLRKGMSNGVSKGGGIKSGVWTSLRSFAYHSLEIKAVCRDVVDGRCLPIIHKIFNQFDDRGLKAVGRQVVQTVDFNGSAEEHRTVVKPGVDQELDAMKRTYDGIEDLLGEASRKIAESIPERYGFYLNVVFFPQIGFLICMPVDPETGRAEWEGGEGEQWERIFTTPDRVYYKDYRMIQLDTTLGDVYANICDREIDIIHELAQRVLEHENLLCDVSDVCGELDSLLALAQGAKMYKLHRPEMTDDNVIDIRNGRHILQELTVPAYIANDTYLVGGSGSSHTEASQVQEGNQPSTVDKPSMFIMTGPNYSGKSVYLKQVALIVYLAHVGSFVPADHAIIGLTDKILTRVSTRETVSKAQSAFMIDLQQVTTAINIATSRSLIIIDEFGKGTNATDGAGLVCGILEHLLSLSEACPKVLAATHFHEIFENGFLAPRPALSYGHMKILIDKEAIETQDQVTYLYSLQPGRSLSSFGTMCASLNGVDQVVIDRAQHLIILAAQGEDLVTACAGINDEELENLNEAEHVAYRLLQKSFLNPEDGFNETDSRAFLEQLVL